MHETCLTTGTFDGVHIGHRKIIDMLNSAAQKQNRRSAMLTFYPHPRKVLFPEDHGLSLLTTMEEKLELLEDAGIDDVIIHPFSMEFSRLDAIGYVRDLLVQGLNMRHMVIGYDHHFGRNREGSIHQLRELAPLYDFSVTEIPAQDIDDVHVSSTKIRRALQSGEIATANAFLGYTFSFLGEVVQGNQRGQGLGFPTANLRILDDTKLIPAQGVYAVEVKIDGRMHKGMMNIGSNPTFGEGNAQSIEVNCFDLDAELYGKELRVYLLKYLRQERRFDSKEALIEQLKIDRQHALSV